MLFEIKTDYVLGDSFFRLNHKSKRVYKPCTMCNNTRFYTITGDRDGDIVIDCPKCSKKSLKGDEYNFREFKTYSVERFVLQEVSALFNHVGSPVVDTWLHSSKGFREERIDLETLRGKVTSKYAEPRVYYSTEKEAKAEARRLNAEQKELERLFLSEEQGDSNG